MYSLQQIKEAMPIQYLIFLVDR